MTFQLSAEPDSSDRTDDRPASIDQASDESVSGQRLVEIRCGFAELAVKEAEAAAVRAAEAKRLFEEQVSVVAEARAAIDEVATHTSKEAAHRAFRTAVDNARSRGQVEAAVGAWLKEINNINGESRMAQVRLNTERETADQRLAELERLSDTAEASATMAASAIEACRAARAALEAAQAAKVEEAIMASASATATAPTTATEAPAGAPSRETAVEPAPESAAVEPSPESAPPSPIRSAVPRLRAGPA